MSKGKPNLKSKAACQWLAGWRATGEPLHHHKANWRVSGLPSLESRQLASNWREHFAAARFSQILSI